MSPADPERWARVEAVLEAALGTTQDGRAELLDQLCAGDPALRDEVDSLLAADARAQGFLEATASSFAAPYLSDLPDPAGPGDAARAVIGRYRLLEEIGHGGMGTVWLAERADGHYEQRVALKLIKRGMHSDEAEARFRRERQILARLTHPAIARLLDGGVSEDGRPYFVMEFIPGLPITRYCDAHRLTVAQRLRLFAAACGAVQYAHRNLVVHRDLKPSNVLVTESGEIKLLDFGVATLLGDQASEPAHRLMTPEYASPEQVAGGVISTASDVYQLGVLLYEVLAGRRPQGVAGAPSQIVVQAGDIPHRDGSTSRYVPGQVAEQRGTSPERLQRALRGDLDTIALRALRQEPAQRYASASEMAEEVERHLAHLPLRFGGTSWRYRAGKFLRRHRTRAAVAALLGVAAVGLGAGYVLQIRAERDRARREEAKASESAGLLQRMFRGWNPDAADRQEMSAARMLADATRRAESELRGDPATLASILSVLGDLEAAIGEKDAADSLLLRALAFQERAPGATPVDLATTLGRRGRLIFDRGQPREGEVLLRRALTILRATLEPGRPELLLVQFHLANALSAQEKLPEAESLLRDALDRLPDESTPLRTEIASSLGYVLFLQARYEEAAAILRPTLERQRAIFGRLHVSPFRTMRFLASALRDQGQLDEAESLDREALTIGRILFGANHPETVSTILPLALVLERKGEFPRAEEVARETLARTRIVFGRGSLTEAHVLRTLGGIRLARGDTAGAEAMLRQALEDMQQHAPEAGADQGDVLNRLAYCAIVRRASDAGDIYRRAVTFEQARPARGPYFVTDGYEYLGESARLMGDRELAGRLFQRALTLYERQLPAGHPYRTMAASGLARLGR